MPTLTARPPKSKITITLSRDLLHQLDLLLESPESPSRSQLVEEALRRWMDEYAKKDLERQTEAYYRSLSKTEQGEDRAWSDISAASAMRLWDQ